MRRAPSPGPRRPTYPSGRVGAGPATDAPRFGTTTCSPSTSGLARFTAARSAPGLEPPAASRASSTLAPTGSRTTPARRTCPTTCTTSCAAVAVAEAFGVARAVAATAELGAVPGWWCRGQRRDGRGFGARAGQRAPHPDDAEHDQREHQQRDDRPGAHARSSGDVHQDAVHADPQAGPPSRPRPWIRWFEVVDHAATLGIRRPRHTPPASICGRWDEPPSRG